MEFNIIKKHFKDQCKPKADIMVGIGDDCAVVKPPAGNQLAMSTDTMVAGVHYYLDVDPHALGYKSLAVSLSDLAAMGAKPAWCMLSMTMPKYDKSWMDKFCEGFFSIADQYNVALIGGDMTSGRQSITTQVTGFLPENISLKRSGAKPGDSIYITGALGDAALALAGIEGECFLPDDDISALMQALGYPTPRIQAGIALRKIATAAIDISDGLVADLGHILTQSGVGASINIEQIPLSTRVQEMLRFKFVKSEKVIECALSGGDDYELCFTSSSAKLAELDLGCPVTCIGKIEAQEGLRVFKEGIEFEVSKKGYEHF